MKKHIVYQTRGTCSRQIEIFLSDDGIIEDVSFLGGCNGNTTGISQLVRGMKAEDAIGKLSGIRCGSKPTSCPDQLSRALREGLEDQSK